LPVFKNKDIIQNMGIRKISFRNNYYYHIYNRGVDKRNIFVEKGDLIYFTNRLLDLNTHNVSNLINMQRRNLDGVAIENNSDDKLVSIVSYCLLPNHFHLLLKQEKENGITKFMQRLGTSYTMFFNNKYERTGSLFSGKFKAKMLDKNFSLPTISSYINLNYKYHQINPKENLVKSSIFEFLGKEDGRRYLQ
jgi:putative transposase